MSAVVAPHGVLYGLSNVYTVTTAAATIILTLRDTLKVIMPPVILSAQLIRT